MNKEDLIKKLETTDLPNIKTPGHKEQLKQTLLAWNYGKRKRVWGVFGVERKILIPVSALTLLIVAAFFVSNILFPQYTLAEVREIALRDPQIQEWVAEGNEIKDIEIIKNTAYVLITPKEAQVTLQGEIGKQQFNGVLVSIQLRKKRVSKIEHITPKVIPLTNQEKEDVKNIIKSTEEKNKIIEVNTVESVPIPAYKLQLIRRNDTVEVLPEQGEKRAKIIYKINGQTKEGLINVKQSTIEKLDLLQPYQSEDVIPQERSKP